MEYNNIGAHVSTLQYLKELKILNLKGNDFSPHTDILHNTLCSLDKLVTLNVSNTNIGYDITILQSLSRLATLNARTLPGISVRSLESLSGLTELDISSNSHFNIRDVRRLRFFTALTSLGLADTHIITANPQSVDLRISLRGLSRLTFLNIAFSKPIPQLFTSYPIWSKLPLPSLKTVIASSSNIRTDLLEELRKRGIQVLL